jgi:hypothetical protein
VGWDYLFNPPQEQATIARIKRVHCLLSEAQTQLIKNNYSQGLSVLGINKDESQQCWDRREAHSPSSYAVLPKA